MIMIDKQYKEIEMYHQKEVCGKISTLFPEFGTCGDNINVAFNDNVNNWKLNSPKMVRA